VEDVKCLNCQNEIFENDKFCGFCGANINEQIKLKEQMEKQNEEKLLEEEKSNDAENFLINSDGNKYMAIKEFIKKYNVTNEEAISYINKSLQKIEKSFDVNGTDSNLNQNNNNNSEKIPENSSVNNSDKNSNPNGICKVIIIGSDSHKKATSAVGRAFVGSLLLGPIGLLAGTTAKNKNTTTFQVIYNNGKKEIITVKTGSWFYKKLCQYL
jgi:hypothetical protein